MGQFTGTGRQVFMVKELVAGKVRKNISYALIAITLTARGSDNSHRCRHPSDLRRRSENEKTSIEKEVS
jgi:hypothetical protein